MRGQVMERPLMAAKLQRMKRHGLLGLLRIGALLERKSELELSDDQLQKLLAIRADMIRAKAKLTGDIRVARLGLVYNIASNIGSVDPAQVRSSLKDIYNMRLERKAITIDAFKKAADVLNNNQKDMIRDMIWQHVAEFEENEDTGTMIGED